MHRYFVLLNLALIISIPTFGQEENIPSFEDTLAVYQDLFEIKEPLNLTLKFNLKEFQKTKTKREEPYLPAELTCEVSDDFHVTHQVRVRPRGEIRKTLCMTPPVWLNIRHAGIEAEDLNDVIKMKVVVRCRSQTIYDSYVLREYLVYQIYNLLSPYSFNTRLVRLKIIDTGRDNKESVDWAFIIEPEAMMAERNNCMPIKSDKLSLATVNRDWMDKVAFFSYMISQMDYSVTGRHNLKILTSKDYSTTGFIPVPYDFDYCGFVNATYAIPTENLGITHVRERYYLGACRSKEVHEKTIAWLASYREEILDLIQSLDYLDDKDKVDLVDYIESYYKETEQKNFIERRIDPTCR